MGFGRRPPPLIVRRPPVRAARSGAGPGIRGRGDRGPERRRP